MSRNEPAGPRRRTAAETRAHILAVARDLFYWNGIRATGVDRVAAAADVAAPTLYRLWPSKDDLVVAYVAGSAEGYRAWFDAATSSGGDDPRAQILAVFAAQAEQVQPHVCRGCPFLMALAEYPDPEHPVHRASVAAKQWVADRFARLAADYAEDRDSVDAAALAAHLVLLMEGVYGSVAALGAAGPALHAGDLVAALLRAT
jgi:AcrR family transcriptional regulator